MTAAYGVSEGAAPVYGAEDATTAVPAVAGTPAYLAPGAEDATTAFPAVSAVSAFPGHGAEDATTAYPAATTAHSAYPAATAPHSAHPAATTAYPAATAAEGTAASYGEGVDETVALNNRALRKDASRGAPRGASRGVAGGAANGAAGSGQGGRVTHDVTVQLPTALTGAPSRGDEPEPVFVDSSGGRRRLLRKFGWLLGVASLGYAVVLGISLAGGDAGAPDVLIPGPEKKASDKVDPSPSKSRSSAPEVVADPTPDPSTPPTDVSSDAPAAEGTGGGAETGRTPVTRNPVNPPKNRTTKPPPKTTPNSPKPPKTEDPPPDPDPGTDPGGPGDPDPGETGAAVGGVG
ncbi:hypothetical protein [Streptomyces iconiensis]|uniref:Translation initiation factor IF-2 n=1 Tax=Streptomyces iconiensis TaxID=1384038 RepID=A0ABT7A464_9ACTN|nr:hypothetical protein [Streptomyces iconiensis]MDJ1136125.1 hypothetical protein [Streptomyces iconiensis]